MDPKPPERIILDDGKSQRYQKSFDDQSDGSDPRVSLKSLDNEPKIGVKEGNESPSIDQQINKSEDDQNVDEKSVTIEYNHDDKHETDQKVVAKSDLDAKESIHKSDEPIIVYAVKAEEKQRSESFQTSHRIPNVDEGERKFETSHHIPAHIEDERTKSIENAKIGQKPLNI